MIQFEGWPKTPRLNKTGSMTITEKIDGTNAAVVIMPLDRVVLANTPEGLATLGGFEYVQLDAFNSDDGFLVGAQSRKRLIAPGNDNAGFAAWVAENAETLVRLLGPGRHFGEWWGQGIQSRYNMSHKVFSLFNSHRWEAAAPELRQALPGLDVVPVLYKGSFDSSVIQLWLDDLRYNGSRATLPYDVKFDKPEGVIIYHHELRGSLKAFVENDDVPKGAQV